MATNNTASVVANPLLEINTTDLYDKKIGILAVNNPESYNQRELGFIDPTSLQLRIDINDNIVNLIENPNYGNNYNLILPRNKNNLSETYTQNGLTPSGVETYLAKLPNLSSISADFLINTDIGGDFWEITWNYDGTFGKQIASYKGLKFARYSINKAFTNWSFCDDSSMIGTLRLDYLNIAQGTNVMGWIKTPTTVSLNKDQYPLLFEYIKTHWGKAASVKDDLGTLTITNEAGLYPRFVGNQNAGFTTNPDCSSKVPSDNVDYANKNFFIRGKISLNKNVKFSYWDNDFTSCQGFSGDGTSYLEAVNKFGGLELSYNSNKHSISSNNETRPKTKFFSLLIYAGYPMQ